MSDFVLRTPIIGGVFVTDIHLAFSSNVRTDEDYLGNILNKLQWCIEKANDWGVPVFIGGDVFDKPSQPDIVKNRLISVLLKSKYPIITIPGNHDTLFNSADNDVKTSLYLLSQTGSLKCFRSGGFYWEDSKGNQVYANFTRPMGQKNIPQIGIYHGFLNSDTDKFNRFFFDDIDHDDPSLIFLGHDHVPYDPVPYRNSVIHRPGSLVRAIRNDSEDREPQLIRFQLKHDTNGYRWITKYYSIPCLSSKLIFKTKKVKFEDIEKNYDDVIAQIKKVSSDDIDLIDALRLVSVDEVVRYVEQVRDEVINRTNSK